MRLFEIVAQIESRPPDDGDAAKAGVGGARADHLGDPLVTEELGDAVTNWTKRLWKAVLG